MKADIIMYCLAFVEVAIIVLFIVRLKKTFGHENKN